MRLPLLLRLLMQRPIVAILVLTIYGLVLLLGAMAGFRRGGLLIAIVAAFGAAALAALLTERIARTCAAARELAIPNHARAMRHVQAWFLAVVVALPTAAASVLGAAPLPTAAMVVGAAATGALVAMYGGWWLLLALPFMNSKVISTWLLHPILQWSVLAASAVLLYQWLRMPARHERDTVAEPTPADPPPEMGDVAIAGVAPMETLEDPTTRELERYVVATTAGLSPAHLPTRALALALGYGVVTHWWLVLTGACIATGAIFAWRAYLDGVPDPRAYLAITSLYALALVGGINMTSFRWLHTRGEQELMVLAPRWPTSRAVKIAVLQTLLVAHRGILAAWVSVTGFASGFSAIGGSEVVAGLAIIVGASLAGCSLQLSLLSRRYVPRLRHARLFILASIACGAIFVAFGFVTGAPTLALGAALLLGPPAITLAVYLLSPLRMPLEVDPRALEVRT